MKERVTKAKKRKKERKKGPGTDSTNAVAGNDQKRDMKESLQNGQSDEAQKLRASLPRGQKQTVRRGHFALTSIDLSGCRKSRKDVPLDVAIAEIKEKST